MGKVFVFGSLNMDLCMHCKEIPRQGETLAGEGFFTAPGGKGGNQAVAAAKLGAETYMLAKVGQDLFGDMLLESQEKSGVHCEYILRGGSRSGVAIILLSGGDNRILCDYGANLQLTAAEALPVLQKLAQPGDLLLTQLECDMDETFQMLRGAKEMGLATLLNTAPAHTLPARVYADLDFLVVNQTECEVLTGIFPTGEADSRKPLEMLSQRGAAAALVTLGKAGSACLHRGNLHFVPTLPVKLADSTAAGDAYIGAFACALSKGNSLSQAMTFATRAAAVTITRIGAQQAIPTLEELRQFFIENTFA